MGVGAASFERQDRCGTPTLTVSGEIDLATAERLRMELAPLVAAARSCAVVDLSAMTFMDSSGLHALLDVQRKAAATDVRLVLLAPSPACRRVLEVTGTDTLFEIREAITRIDSAAV